MKFFKLTKAEVTQPTKQKPTTTLPDNMQWAWDPNAQNWIAVLKDNSDTTSLYTPNQNNNLTTTTSYMSTIKSSSTSLVKQALDIRDRMLGKGDGYSEKMIIYTVNPEQTEIVDTKVINKTDASSYPVQENDFFLFMDRDTGWWSEDYNLHPTSDLKRYYGQSNKSASIDCLDKFLNGPKYSSEVKIEAGLIKDGLVKYAGFDFNKGTKYAITEEGLKVLRKASEIEHNDALNEREKLAYLFGFNTDEISTEDTTGHRIAGNKKFIIVEANGQELGTVEAQDEIDAKVKFGIEHPEYSDSQSIKAICANYEETTDKALSYPNPSETPNKQIVLENHDGWVNTAAEENFDHERWESYTELMSYLQNLANKADSFKSNLIDTDLVQYTKEDIDKISNIVLKHTQELESELKSLIK